MKYITLYSDLFSDICSQSCCGYDLADVKLVAYVITPKDKSSQPQVLVHRHWYV